MSRTSFSHIRLLITKRSGLEVRSPSEKAIVTLTETDSSMGFGINVRHGRGFVQIESTSIGPLDY